MRNPLHLYVRMTANAGKTGTLPHGWGRRFFASSIQEPVFQTLHMLAAWGGRNALARAEEIAA